MKVLFLDFDGVLNSNDFFKKFDGRFVPDADMIDPVPVAALQDIVDRTGAKIVISSTWRKGFELEELRTMLATKGLVRADIIDTTPWKIGHYNGRGAEIRHWLQNYQGPEPIEGIVILDDDSDMLSLMPWLVQTYWEDGLGAEHVELAEAKLRMAPPTLLERSPEND